MRERSLDRDAAAEKGVPHATQSDVAVPGPGPRWEEAWAVEAAAAVLARRWKPSILWVLGGGPRRFNALAAALNGVTPKVLAEQLRELTRDGLVERTAYELGPKHVEYALTRAGTQLLPALEALDAWGRAHGARPRG